MSESPCLVRESMMPGDTMVYLFRLSGRRPAEPVREEESPSLDPMLRGADESQRRFEPLLTEDDPSRMGQWVEDGQAESMPVSLFLVQTINHSVPAPEGAR